MQAPAQQSARALPDAWQERLQTALLRAPDHEPGHFRYGGFPSSLAPEALAHLQARMPAILHPAAVLVPIVTRATPTVLLTVRAPHLRRHAGQISFPGGRVERSDADPATAALRETGEEIGVPTSFITLCGFLSDHVVMTGYRITPVVAFVRPGFVLRPDGTEVADIFELPLSMALDPACYRMRRRCLHEVEFDVWELVFGERRIWGATAGVLAHLREVMGSENG